ncbi:peptidase inhibitor family I36 protein [Streptomyces sp.]|uniref:peptidase inhibitor family I36 protein n=1 Tax=Streptomyces sp. TaxID=1931 RepID=UPI002810DB3A|nr:peptidase inhibitor family I36 protein [Streptomyces sp.]
MRNLAVKRRALPTGTALATLLLLLALPATADAAGTAEASGTAEVSGSAVASGTAGPRPGTSGGTVLGPCGPGRLCLWPKPDFKGRVRTHELATTDVDSCVALPAGTSAQSLVNRTGRPVTTYQSAECAETGEFETYPGRGVWVPQSPYEVRAFKIWER